MINSVRLNHTVWYSYEKKIIRINISDMLPEPLMSYSYTVSGQIEHPGLVKVHSISKDIKVFGDFDPLLFLSYAPLSGSSEETKKDDWDSRVELKWDEQHKSFDIILPPHKDFDVNKVLVKIPKQAITVSQEVITAALTENVITETIKPTLDKTYYSKEEVDNLIKKLKEELTAEDHDTHSAEEHPQQ